MMKRRHLLLAFVMQLVLSPALCSADEGKDILSSGEWNYYVNDFGTLTIAEWNGQGESVVIPEEIDGMQVTEIGPQVFYCNYGLEDVFIPDSITMIGTAAFASCESLTSIEIPENVTYIEAGAFAWCNTLSSIQVSPNNNSYVAIDNVLFEKTTKTLHTYPCGLHDSEYSIPQGITKIGESALERCTHLRRVEIPNSVTEIGDFAFADCNSLASIYLPDSLYIIGNQAFYNCMSLTNVIMSESITKIGDMAFSWCDHLAYIEIPETVTEIGTRTFEDCHDLTSITLPESIAYIGNNVCDSCPNLIITVSRGSYAEEYCEENELAYVYDDVTTQYTAGSIRGSFWEREGYYGYDSDTLEFFEDGTLHWSAGESNMSGRYEVISDDTLLLRKETVWGYEDTYFGYEFDEDGWLDIWYMCSNNNPWKTLAFGMEQQDYTWYTYALDGLYYPQD